MQRVHVAPVKNTSSVTAKQPNDLPDSMHKKRCDDGSAFCLSVSMNSLDAIGTMTLKTLTRLKTALCIGGVLWLTACSQPAPSDDQAASSAEPAAAAPADTTANPAPADSVAPVQISSLLPVQAYDCLPAQKITATYDRQNAIEPQVMLEINGMIHVLYASSATESIFSTEAGMTDGEGMRWAVSAGSASLTSVPNAGSKSLEKVLYRCTQL